MKNFIRKNRAVVEVGSGKVITEAPLRSIARLGTHGCAEILLEDEENAQLFAAAPDLLVALQVLVGAAECHTISSDPEIADAIQQANAAIARAKAV
jgi:hypothetical protein